MKRISRKRTKHDTKKNGVPGALKSRRHYSPTKVTIGTVLCHNCPINYYGKVCACFPFANFFTVKYLLRLFLFVLDVVRYQTESTKILQIGLICVGGVHIESVASPKRRAGHQQTTIDCGGSIVCYRTLLVCYPVILVTTPKQKIR